jgi:hypothetical protein
MRKELMALGLLAFSLPSAFGAQDHLLGDGVVKARVEQARSERDRDAAIVRDFLESPDATRVAGRLGVDMGRVRSGVSQLSEKELRDLAERATRLRGDPAAGLSHDTNEILIIILIVGIVLLVLKAVD